MNGQATAGRSIRLVAAAGILLLILLPVSVATAAPIPTPTFMRQTGRLYAPVGENGDAFGLSVAVSGDTAVVGAPYVNGSGAAFVYERVGTAWVFVQQLPAEPDLGDEFGYSVDIDGDVIIVGSPGRTSDAGENSGVAVVYERDGTGEWSYLSGMEPWNPSVNTRFGHSVAVSGDRAVVGAPNDGEGGPQAGMAYVFTRDESDSVRIADFEDYAEYDQFGKAVDISGDCIAVGIPDDNLGMNSNQGSVIFFEWDGADWVASDKIYDATAGANDRFGASVSLSGWRAAIGAPGADTASGTDAGEAHLYVRGGIEWEWRYTVGPPASSNYASLGESVALQDTLLIAGAPLADTYNGAAFVFSYTGTSFALQQKISPTGADGGNFAHDVAVSNGTCVVGASLGDGTQTDSGVAYVYSRHEPVYRFYNKRNGSHFYTPNASERDHVIATWPDTYTYEGVAYWVNPFNNTQPLYRFYNKRNGSHFYTASTAERDSVIANLSATYSYDGPTYRVTPVVIPETTLPPVWRFYNKRNGSHFYTASKAEMDSVVANLSAIYTYEGIGFWLGQ